ncbi:MAG: FAD-dependent oxidoreductase, partial [Parasporobacterium sp.]|nr:FAD-dependent oxidoreductase [Parasporobacterium sp.]
MYDVAIIGTGPAGISAALTLRSRGKSVLLLGKRDLSKKMTLAEQIRNYPGLGIVSGKKLAEGFLNHLKEMNIGITQKRVTEISKSGSSFNLLCENETISACSVIIATGVSASHTYPGEESLLGHGVSYCATCDGFLYGGKPIAVVCTSKEFEPEIEYLASVAADVYLLPKYKDIKEFPANVHTVSGTAVEISGAEKVEKISIDGKETAVDAVFVLREAISPGTLLKGLAVEDNHIQTDKNCATNVDGCFAAGDCTGRPYQYVKAAGEGNVAAHAVLEYLSANDLKGNAKTRPYKEYPLSLDDAIAVTDVSGIPTDEEISKIVRYKLTGGSVEYKEKQTAGKGDVITFSAKGAEGRFTKDHAKLTLGQNLYDDDIEKALMGANVGETIKVIKDGREISVEIHNIACPLPVEPTDEMVKAFGDDSVQTLSDFEKKTKDELMEQAIYMITYHVSTELLEEVPAPDTSEEIIKRLGELELGFFNTMFEKEKGKALSAMTPEELRENLGVSSIEEFTAARRDWYKEKHKQVLRFSEA